jgi:hypothetical protein
VTVDVLIASRETRAELSWTNKMYNDPTIVPLGSHVVGSGEVEMSSKLDRRILKTDKVAVVKSENRS